MAQQKSPPYSKESEEAIISCLLMNSELIQDIAEILSVEDFYERRCRVVYQAMITLSLRAVTADLTTISDHLRERKELDMVGSSWLAEKLDALPSSVVWKDYVKIVREKSLLRAVLTHAGEITQKCYQDWENVDEFLNEVEAGAYALATKQTKSRAYSAAELVYHTLQQIDTLRKHSGDLLGVPTGLKRLDENLSGLQKSDLIIIAARPGMGKTSCCLSFVAHAALVKNVPGLIFSLEMSRDQLMMRMLCSEARLNHSAVRNGYLSDRDYPQLAEAAGKIESAPIFIDDRPSNGILQICSMARRMKREKGIGLIAIDYLQLSHGTTKDANLVQEYGEICQRLKGLARELEVPVICLSQLNRQVEYRTDKRPASADLRGSGNIEEAADVIMMLYRDEVYYPDSKDKGIVEINITKQRQGPTGINKFAFIKEYMRFEDLHNGDTYEL